ncbi:flagellin (plasmid) [Salipiger sp. H15]|uniref:Flagellin n=1 Tax=Alloyangia sp. H15 TaxID=3029062 RepID=A0AAU8AQY6_9RHOB
MTSVLTNLSSMAALRSLGNIGKQLEMTQKRISSGLRVETGKDNAAYYALSERMRGDSSAYASISEGLTLSANSVATARLGAESFLDLVDRFAERIAFAQNAEGGMAAIAGDLKGLVTEMTAVISASTFNGDDLVNAAGTLAATPTVSPLGVLTAGAEVTETRRLVTGISRSGGSYGTTAINFETVDLTRLQASFAAIADGFEANATATTGPTFLANILAEVDTLQSGAVDAATRLGVVEKSINSQQDFLAALVDTLDTSVGAMVDADMEEEAARLQALQIQQQLATQALSIANAQPQGILTLFE